MDTMHIELWMSKIEEIQLLISLTQAVKYWAKMRKMLYNSQFIDEHPMC